jgi:hypothetical protein
MKWRRRRGVEEEEDKLRGRLWSHDTTLMPVRTC